MGSGVDLDDMPNCLCFGLRRAARALTQFYGRHADTAGLRATQSPVLTALSFQPRLSMAQLSGELGLERTTLLRNLKPLERAALVRIRSSGRGVAASVEITEKGRRARATMLPGWRRAQKTAIATLGASRWAEIMSDLRRAQAALERARP